MVGDYQNTAASTSDEDSLPAQADSIHGNDKDQAAAHDVSTHTTNQRKARWHYRSLFTKGSETTIDTTWRTDWLRWSPLSGLCCLAFVLLSIPASATILKTSDQQAVESWRIGPNVWLVVLTAIGNKALGYAALQAGIITWWLRALDGSTVEKLHRDWSHGPGMEFWSILTAGRRTTLLALTSLSTVAILADGVLIQRAVEVTDAVANDPVLLRLRATPQLPTNYTGSEGNHGMNTLSSGFIAVYEDFVRGNGLVAPDNDCPGRCDTTIRAAAMIRNGECRELDNGFIDLPSIKEVNQATLPSFCNYNMLGLGSRPREFSCPLFLSHLANAAGPGRESIEMYYGTIDKALSQSQRVGNFTMWYCSLFPATAEFPASVFKNGTVEVDYSSPKFVAFANNTGHDRNGGRGLTLGGISTACNMRVSDSVYFFWPIDPPTDGLAFSLTQIGSFSASLMLNTEEFAVGIRALPQYEVPFAKMEACVNEVMVRTSFRAASTLDEQYLKSRIDEGLDIPDHISGIRVDQVPTYRTRWGFFIGAAVIQLVCVALVSATYWNYGKLGRTVSLSPLEIAKAFDSPIFRTQVSNLEGNQIAKQMHHVRIRYGAVGEESGDSLKRRLVFADPEKTYRPMDTFEFGP